MSADKKPILLVDDEVDLRECIADFLGSEGYEVVQAENGQVALNLLKTGLKPSVILLDYMMPVMDGKAFCEVYNNDSSINSFPVILLTAAKVPDEKLEQMQIKHQLDKPIKIEKFLEAIAKFNK